MRELRLVLLGLAAAMALMVSGGFLWRALNEPGAPPVRQQQATPSPTPEEVSPAVRASRAALEALFAQSPDYTRFFDRLRLVFPTDYDRVLDTVAAAHPQLKDANLDVLMAEAVTALRRMRGTLASKASDDALGQIFALQLKEMRELETRDPHLCVAFLYGANGPGFLSFAADHRGLVADSAIAGLEAMNSGRSDPIQRGAPTDADFQAIDQALVNKGLARPQIDALLDGKVADPPIPDPDMCKAGETYLETLAGLPPEVRGRLYGLAVDLMAKS